MEVSRLRLFFELTPDSFSGSVVTGSGASLSSDINPSETFVCLTAEGSSGFCLEEAGPFGGLTLSTEAPPLLKEAAGVLCGGLPSCPGELMPLSDFEDS